MLIKSEQYRLDRVEAYIAASNLMGKYVFYRMHDMLPQVTALFANRDDVRIEMPSGIYTGNDAAYRCFEVDHAVDELADPTLVIHDITTPVIEVAGDCQTAKGVWVSPGIATASMPSGKRGLWAWVKYDCDFIRQEDTWKIWHMRKYEVFTVPTDKSWVDENPMELLPPVTQPNEPKPKHCLHSDLPPSVSTKFNPKHKVPALPLPPEPYDTWEEQ